jgi:branched-chain amino acid transport system substrate-binding protein
MHRRAFQMALVGAASAVAHPLFAAAAPGPIKIGQSGVLSGPIGAQLKQFDAGAQLVFDRVNRGGGIGGRPLELVALDDGLQPEKTLENTRTLLQDSQLAALFGYTSSQSVSAVAPLLRESGIPLVAPLSVTASLRAQTARTAYYVRAGYEREVRQLYRQITTLGIQRIALAYLASGDRTEAAGEEAKAVLEQELAASGRVPVAAVPLLRDGSNLAEAAASLAAVKPEAVILVAPGTFPARLIAEVEKRGAVAQYYSSSIIGAEATAQLLGPRMRSIVVAQVVPYPWGTNEPAVVEFRKLAEAAKAPVSYALMEGYVSGSVLVEALKRTPRDLSPARVHGAIRSLRGRIAGVDIDYTSTNTGSRFVELVQITGEGRFVR